MLQIGAALFYYKLGKILLQRGAASLSQVGASVLKNWGSYYKLGQPLLQNRAAAIDWTRHYKLGQSSSYIWTELGPGLPRSFLTKSLFLPKNAI